ncbi:MAG: hypothetical protein KH941_17825, partial [Clostridiales bacterium]|nr:hypothetical protein [Clostridiales bacterium]
QSWRLRREEETIELRHAILNSEELPQYNGFNSPGGFAAREEPLSGCRKLKVGGLIDERLYKRNY